MINYSKNEKGIERREEKVIKKLMKKEKEELKQRNRGSVAITARMAQGLLIMCHCMSYMVENKKEKENHI
ncbi:hypothetical protein OIU78_012455 [Salix suchowensis]|nr:hypothetical protein OIU78_012455 [Salix suchowensis]